MTQILAIAQLEMKRLMRTRLAFTLLLLVPALQVILFGYAIRPGGAEVHVVIAAPTAQLGATVAKRLRTDAGIKIIADNLKPGEAAAQVRSGRATIGIEVPETRSLANPFAPLRPFRVIIDGTNAALTEASAARISTDYWRAVADRAEASGPGLEIARLYNPKSRADWTFLPALIGVTMMISMVLLGSLSLAREREAGTWETLLSLPVGRGKMLAGKLLPYLVLGTVQGILVLGAAVLLFDLPTRGSVIALIALLPIFAAAHFLLGYAISARARTQLEALQGAIAFYLPAMLLSGFLYPFETLPNWARMIGNIFPLTHFIRIARDLLLRGADVASLWGDALAITTFALIAGGIGLLLQSRRLD